MRVRYKELGDEPGPSDGAIRRDATVAKLKGIFEFLNGSPVNPAAYSITRQGRHSRHLYRRNAANAITLRCRASRFERENAWRRVQPRLRAPPMELETQA